MPAIDLLKVVQHRPYPPNEAPWVMRQEWMNLAFLHWPLAPELLRPHVPQSLELDMFDGRAWLGVVPFEMTLRSRWSPIPRLRFPELNVRTYVRRGDKTGVYFFSLDAASRIAVEGARIFFHLPYYFSHMQCDTSHDTINYRALRFDRRSEYNCAFQAQYRPTGEPFTADQGSLEYFLTERYCLFNQQDEALHCCDIHHAPWPLQHCEVEIITNEMIPFLKTRFTDAPHALFAKYIDTIEWLPRLITFS